jgi:hypothetical protein
MSTVELGVDLAQKTTADLEYKIAATRDEREAAFRLVYDAYLRSGLCAPNPHEMRVTPYHLLPTTETFIAACLGKVVSTVTLVVDGELGLPMECVYGREVARRRQQGLLLGEVSCLADRREDFKRLFPVYIRLCRLMGQYARRRGLNELLVAVHPRHARFYQRFMAFAPIGEEIAYPTVCDNPAVALSFDFIRVEREYPDIHEKFFGDPIPDEQLQPRPITMAECAYFRPMVASSFDHARLDEAGRFCQSADARPAISAA